MIDQAGSIRAGAAPSLAFWRGAILWYASCAADADADIEGGENDEAARSKPGACRGAGRCRGVVLLVELPLGLFLPAGIQLGVDDRAMQNLPVQRCDANGCYAGLAVDASLLADLKAGKALRLTMRNMTQEPVTLEVPLAGFTAAFERID